MYHFHPDQIQQFVNIRVDEVRKAADVRRQFRGISRQRRRHRPPRERGRR